MNALDTYLNTNNMTDSAFARKAGLHQPTIWRIKKGKVKPSPDLALRIEQATGGAVTRMELLYPEEKEQIGSRKKRQ